MILALQDKGRRILYKWGIWEDDERFDDLLQEGVIAGWLATQVPRRDPMTYATVAMKNRMLNMLRKPTKQFGALRNKGKEYDMFNGNKEGLEAVENKAAPDLFDALDMTEDITNALLCLEGKDRIIAVGIALGHTFKELGEDLDMYSWAVESRWEQHIRPKLREELDILLAA